MRTPFVVVLAMVPCLAGCAQSPNTPGGPAAPLAPTAVVSSPGDVEVPFHSEVAAWEKTPGSDIGLCTHPLPTGKVYLMRNTNRGTAVSTHLGIGDYHNHTCVYGIAATAQAPAVPQGWFAEMEWTAANGDVLLATSEFLYWTGVPGRSVAVDKMTFTNGGTGRFEFVEGEGLAYANAPERSAMFEGALRYGKKEK